MHDKTVFTAKPRWTRRIGVATTALAGALSVAMTVPHASADSAYQPALDQLLDAMQQAANYDAALAICDAGQRRHAADRSAEHEL